MSETMNDGKAPPGAIWVCSACGKTARDKYAEVDDDERSWRWDVSCMMNAILCREDSLIQQDGRAIKADPFEQETRGIE